MIITKPKERDLSDYYRSYLATVPEFDLMEALVKRQDEFELFVSEIPESMHSFAYASGKWTIKEVIGHLIDTERILVYRALRIARSDQTPLPGFDENHFVLFSGYSTRTWESIMLEKQALSDSTHYFFQFLDQDCYDRTGLANNSNVSVRSLLFFIIAHERHHLNIIRTRYLNTP
ncbi:MAG: DinB family protein [Bacteroidetes bacterium]|nr:MAG: DinB family protein [Bacteroidota bacterium]REJ99793.1 MAG: DinB family protein [Bacteroidota bacterium]REK34166.1 MAG: DinB family protein [Bacteroidota bacterium]REK50496.1 MAG: DinB family protein [Bacteroidota bacterium]